MTYHQMIRILAVKRCHAAGATVEDLAKQAGVSQATIRRWLAV